MHDFQKMFPILAIECESMRGTVIRWRVSSDELFSPTFHKEGFQIGKSAFDEIFHICVSCEVVKGCGMNTQVRIQPFG